MRIFLLSLIAVTAVCCPAMDIVLKFPIIVKVDQFTPYKGSLVITASAEINDQGIKLSKEIKTSLETPSCREGPINFSSELKHRLHLWTWDHVSFALQHSIFRKQLKLPNVAWNASLIPLYLGNKEASEGGVEEQYRRLDQFIIGEDPASTISSLMLNVSEIGRPKLLNDPILINFRDVRFPYANKIDPWPKYKAHLLALPENDRESMRQWITKPVRLTTLSDEVPTLWQRANEEASPPCPCAAYIAASGAAVLRWGCRAASAILSIPSLMR